MRIFALLKMSKNPLFFLSVILFGIGLSAAQAETQSEPGAAPAAAVGSAGDSENSQADKAEPFAPHWTGEVGFNYSTQPSQSGQGQITSDFILTGTYNLTQGGHFFSLAAGGGQQTVEGANSNYGTFIAGAGLGLGFFLPSMDFTFEQGAATLNSINSTLTLDFQLFDSLTLGVVLGGGYENHQGPKSQIPIKGWKALDKIVEIDSENGTGEITANFKACDFLSFSLTGEDEFSETYQIQTVLHSVQTPLSESEQISSVILGSSITFFDDLILDLSLQEGQELLPAGTIYSQVLKQTVNFSKPTAQNFSGYTFSLSYNLP